MVDSQFIQRGDSYDNFDDDHGRDDDDHDDGKCLDKFENDKKIGKFVIMVTKKHCFNQMFVMVMILTRWWIMGTVILLNLANFAHWIAFPAIAKKAAAYYDVSGKDIFVQSCKNQSN